MRKKITLLLFSLLSILYANAGGGWAISATSITKNAGQAYLYTMNTSEGWTDGSWMGNNELNNYNFGTPTSLILNGAYGNGWSDDSPGYTSASFVLYYRVYKAGTTPGSWSQIAMDSKDYQIGNNYIYSKSNANIDLLALATETGTNTYTLEVVMTKNQFYTGGNWISMIPGGQSIAYNSTSSGYMASFTKTILTDINQITNNIQISTTNGQIKASFDGSALVELYSISGQLINRQTASKSYTYHSTSGMYILKINGKSHKIIVH